MNVLVAGGTGFIGTNLCRELHDRGHAVTALSRHSEGAGLPSGVDTVSADVSVSDSIVDEVGEHDAVVNLVSLSPLFQPPSGTSHEAVHLEGTKNLVRAAEAVGVHRFVQMSGLGVDPDGATDYLRAKGRAETVVEASSLDWVLYRPSVVFGEGSEFVAFTRTLSTPYLTALPGGGTTRFQPIWIGDLAPMLADGVEADEHVGEHYDLGGPEVLTLADVTKLVYAAEGKPVRVLPIPMALVKVALTLAGPLPFVPFGPDQARSLQIDNVPSNNDVSAFGRDEADLTSMRAYFGLESPDP